MKRLTGAVVFLLLFCTGSLLHAEILLPPGTPVFTEPAHNRPVIAVTNRAMTVESLPPLQMLIAKHPLARYFTFHPVRLPNGQSGYADLDCRVVRQGPAGTPHLIFTPYRPWWRNCVMGAALAGISALLWDLLRRKQGNWVHFAGLPVLARIFLLMILIQRTGNLIASPMDENGYFQNLASFLSGDFSQRWHYTVGTSILYFPFAWLTNARNAGDILIPFSLFSGLVMAPGCLVLGYFVGKKLTGSGMKSGIAMLLWAVWPFFNHHFAGFGIREFWSYFALPSGNFDFACYVNIIAAGYNAMSDVSSTLAVLGTMTLVLYGKPSWTTALCAGLLFGFGCTIRINNVLFVPVLVLLVWFYQRKLFNWKSFLTALVGSCIGFLPQFWANGYFFGNPLRFSYTNYAEGAHTYLSWIFFRTTAAYYGAANHACWILGGMSLWLMGDRKLRLILAVWAVPVILFFTLYSHGTDDAVRFILTSYPALFLAVTGCGIWEKLTRRGAVVAAAYLGILVLIPPNVTDAGVPVWYPWRTLAPAAGTFFCWKNNRRTILYFAGIGFLHLFGNGYILTALLASVLVFAVISPVWKRS